MAHAASSMPLLHASLRLQAIAVDDAQSCEAFNSAVLHTGGAIEGADACVSSLCTSLAAAAAVPASCPRSLVLGVPLLRRARLDMPGIRAASARTMVRRWAA